MKKQGQEMLYNSPKATQLIRRELGFKGRKYLPRTTTFGLCWSGAVPSHFSLFCISGNCISQPPLLSDFWLSQWEALVQKCRAAGGKNLGISPSVSVLIISFMALVPVRMLLPPRFLFPPDRTITAPAFTGGYRHHPRSAGDRC